MMSKFFFKIHRVLGSILSLFFLIWFASGFVMLFHTFPGMSKTDRIKTLQTLASLDSIRICRLDSLFSLLPSEGITALTLRSHHKEKGDYQLSWETKGEKGTMGTRMLQSIDYTDALAYAQRYSTAPILRVDTIHEPDTWVPYKRDEYTFPIYRFFYADSLHTELSVAAQTAEGVQATTRSSRFWAYMGAIPHWIYFSSLRQHRELWSTSIIIIAALGTLMCLAGIYIGVCSFWRSYRSSRVLKIPYKRGIYRWHHILGFVFGLSVLSFIFSGMMSFREVPQSVFSADGSVIRKLEQQQIKIDKHQESIWIDKLIRMYVNEQPKMISWHTLGDISYWEVFTAKGSYAIRLQGNNLVPLNLSEAEVTCFAHNLMGTDASVKLLTHYDNYYIDRRGGLPLPVYLLEGKDADLSSLYLQPYTGEFKYYDENSRLYRILYQGLHSLIFAPLIARPWLWWVLILLCLTGGLLLSYTSVVLSLRKIFRKWRKTSRNRP